VIDFFSMLFAGLTLPRVQSPWPESIGLGFPFAMAGAAGVLASRIQPEVLQAERDRAIRVGNLWSFRLGAAFYLLSLAFQVVLVIGLGREKRADAQRTR
jgi:hypothetical protein